MTRNGRLGSIVLSLLLAAACAAPAYEPAPSRTTGHQMAGILLDNGV